MNASYFPNLFLLFQPQRNSRSFHAILCTHLRHENRFSFHVQFLRIFFFWCVFDFAWILFPSFCFELRFPPAFQFINSSVLFPRCFSFDKMRRVNFCFGNAIFMQICFFFLLLFENGERAHLDFVFVQFGSSIQVKSYFVSISKKRGED